MKGLITLVSAILLKVNSARYNGLTNQAGVNLIKEFQGFNGNFYSNPSGMQTIGYGHACNVWNCAVPLNGRYKVPLSKPHAEALLKDDLRAAGSYESCVRNAVRYPNLNANQFSALVSLTFNVGCGALQSSTLLIKLNQGDVSGAANEFGRFANNGGIRQPSLVQRRDAEKALFCAGGACKSLKIVSVICTGSISAITVKVRSKPSTTSPVVGTVYRGTSVTINGRQIGTIVQGNKNWFKIYNGFVPAFNVNIARNNGAAYCSQT